MRGYEWSNLWTSVGNRIVARACDVRGDDWFDREWNDMIVARKKLIGQRLKRAIKTVMKQNDLRFSSNILLLETC
jgi:hypothetical protein